MEENEEQRLVREGERRIALERELAKAGARLVPKEDMHPRTRMMLVEEMIQAIRDAAAERAKPVTRTDKLSLSRYWNHEMEYVAEFGVEFALYGGEDAVVVMSCVELGDDVRTQINDAALERVKQAGDLDAVGRIRDEAKEETVYGSGWDGPSWLEDPKKVRDTDYLCDVMLRIETFKKRKDITALETKYGLKFRKETSVEYGPRDGAFDVPIARGDEPMLPTITVTYRIAD